MNEENSLLKKMRKAIITAFIIMCINISFGQKESYIPDFKTSYHSYLSSGSDLPFWFTTNQNGVFTMQNSTYQLITGSFKRELERDSLKDLGFTYGANLVYGYASESDLHLNQAWAGIRYKWLVFNVGMQSEPIARAGLSSTNGNIMWSNNARPLPRIEFASNGFIPFFFWKDWFSLKFEYEENFLNNRYVDGAMLHHKNLFFSAKLPKSWRITAGLDHWVYWGGTSPVLGELPGVEDYIRYILGSGGSINAPLTDQLNVAGNSLGMYVVEVDKIYDNIAFSFYYNHPFEDHSGMDYVNWKDGLWGLQISRKNRDAWLTDFVYEYMNTMNQSGAYHQIPDPTPEDPNNRSGLGRDNYFLHGVYRSSHTNYNRMMGTPLFVPVVNGNMTGFDGTRIQMHHIGVKGKIRYDFSWKSLFTWSKNYGFYGAPSTPYPQNEFSFITTVKYTGNKLPFIVNTGIATDIGDRFEDRVGGFIGIIYKF
jgi:hypothetical protein